MPFWNTVLTGAASSPPAPAPAAEAVASAPSSLEALEVRALERRRLLFGGAGKRSILPEKRVVRKDPRILELTEREKADEAKRARKMQKRGKAEAASNGAASPGVSEPPKPRWERLQAGTRLRVWWDGSEEYFPCVMLGFRVAYNDDREVVYTHRCQYENGVIEHDLSKTEFEVCDEEVDGLEVDGPQGGVGIDHEVPAAIARIHAETPRRRWLSRQEGTAAASDELLEQDRLEQEAVDGLESARAGSDGAAGHDVAALRGKETLRRLRKGTVDLLKSPLKGRALSLVNTDVDGNDMAYRI